MSAGSTGDLISMFQLSQAVMMKEGTGKQTQEHQWDVSN